MSKYLVVLLILVSALSSMLSSFVVTNLSCGLFPLTPCGNLVGWPLPFAKYAVSFHEVPIRVYEGGYQLPLLAGHPHRISNLSILFFALNTAAWLIIILVVWNYLVAWLKLWKRKRVSFFNSGVFVLVNLYFVYLGITFVLPWIIWWL